MTQDDYNYDVNDDVALPDDITALLGDETTWAPLSDELEASIVASVLAEVDLFDGTVEIDTGEKNPDVETPVKKDTATASARPSSDSRADSPAAEAKVVSISRWKTAALGAAAALLVVAGIFGVMQQVGGPDLELAMAGTPLAPNASAVAEITDTPEGTRIVISVTDLPPAAPGTYYQAWLRVDAEVGVSAGTFHLRDGSKSIELWAGVSTDDYPLVTVTLQQEAQTESSGQVVLKALIEPAD